MSCILAQIACDKKQQGAFMPGFVCIFLKFGSWIKCQALPF